jgi:hypothetical protein
MATLQLYPGDAQEYNRNNATRQEQNKNQWDGLSGVESFVHRHWRIDALVRGRGRATCLSMTFGEIFVLGKALIWFGIPIGLALWELRRLARDKALREASRGASRGALREASLRQAAAKGRDPAARCGAGGPQHRPQVDP